MESTLEDHVLPVERASEESRARTFTIIYAGGLSKAYGVDRLIEAVMMLSPDVSVCLKLYGKGDQEDKVSLLSCDNPRFFYGGFVDSATLMSELCAADLLINPRPTNSLVSAQSFPSKLIEYLVSGCPVLTTRIPSIPGDLERHYFYIDDESPVGICTSIYKVMRLSLIERRIHGKAAQEFVKANYSEAVIGRRISVFINNLN
jgi:glycosyltransferase involved in cell wall biosynthesis